MRESTSATLESQCYCILSGTTGLAGYNIEGYTLQSAMIMPIFTYCGYNSLGWSESRKHIIRSIEKRSLEVITPKCSPKNCNLRFLTIDNFLQKKTCCFVFDCLNGTTCFAFSNYFQRFHYNSLNTRNNGEAAKLPKEKVSLVRRCFYFLGALLFNSLLLSLRKINSINSSGQFFLVTFIVVFNPFFNLVHVSFLYFCLFLFIRFLMFSQQDPIDNSTWY